MKSKQIILLFLWATASLWTGIAFGSARLPSVLIPGKCYVFNSVLDGEKILHDFVVQNTGTAALLIQGVRTD